MNRFFQYLNLLGVLLLVGLSIAQWMANRSLHLVLAAQSRTLSQQADKIAADEKLMANQQADLDDFRTRLAATEHDRDERGTQLKDLTAQLAHLTTDRDQLQKAYDTVNKSLQQWRMAVAQRDEALAKAGTVAKQLADDRNDAVARYNALVGQFNAAAGEIKKAGEAIRSVTAQRDEAVSRFNELAKKYNALVAGGAATKPG